MAFWDFIKGGKNPADDAMPYLERIPRFGRAAYQPYIEQGREAREALGSEGMVGQSPFSYQKMAADPMAVMNAIMESYQPSRYSQYQQDLVQKAMQNSAAAGGYAGTTEAQREQGQMARDITSQDLQQYLQNIFGLQGRGVAGIEGQINRGYGADVGLADYMGNVYGSMAQTAGAGRQSKEANRNALISALLGLPAQAAGSYFGAKNAAAAAA